MSLGRIVVKVGSSTLAGESAGIDADYVASLVAQVCELKERGWQPVVVSSGAIAAGIERLGDDVAPRGHAFAAGGGVRRAGRT